MLSLAKYDLTSGESAGNLLPLGKMTVFGTTRRLGGIEGSTRGGTGGRKLGTGFAGTRGGSGGRTLIRDAGNG
eukprot:Pgem_evm1s13562